MGAKLSRAINTNGRWRVRRRGFKVLNDCEEEAIIVVDEENKLAGVQPVKKRYKYIGSDDSDYDEEDSIDEVVLVEIDRLEWSSSSSDSSYCIKKYKSETTRTERFFDRRLRNAKFTQSKLVQKLISESQKKFEAHEEKRQRVYEWTRSRLPPTIKGPQPYMLITVDITLDEALALSKIVFEVTQPIVLVADLRPINLDKRKPFIMVHETNEYEIMTTLASFRLNPFTEGVRLEDSLAFVDTHDIVAETIFRVGQSEKNRREYAYNSREYHRLDVETAYKISNGIPVPGVPNEVGTAAVVRYINRNETCINMIPSIQCRRPIHGIPFKKLMLDVLDAPECPIQLLQAINVFLRPYELQIIDLRIRFEEVVEMKPFLLDETQVARETCEMIVRSRHLIRSLRNTSKYFALYAFYTYMFPYRFYQAIVRYIPGVPINPVDFVITEGSRPQAKEPNPTSHKFNNLYFPPSAILGRKVPGEARAASTTRVKTMTRVEIEY